MRQRSIRVFLDTNMMKYSADELPRWSSRVQGIRWDRIEQDITVYDPVVVKPREMYDRKLALETAHLPFIAFLARSGRLELLSHAEAEIERWGLKDIQDPRGRFYGAPITEVPDPILYSRVVLAGSANPLPPLRTTNPLPEHKHRQVAFIAALSHPRLLQLRQACGADQSNGIEANQMIDAFHLWCAETGGATHFLTAERRLLDLGADSRLSLKCKPVLPSQLVEAICPQFFERLYHHAKFKLEVWRHPQRWHVDV